MEVIHLFFLERSVFLFNLNMSKVNVKEEIDSLLFPLVFVGPYVPQRGFWFALFHPQQIQDDRVTPLKLFPG